MVNYNTALEEVSSQLKQAGIEDASYEARLLLEYGLGISRLENRSLTKTEWEQLLVFTKKRSEHYPLQYIIGSWQFLDLELKVGPGVLIPRAETEEVCLFAINQIKELLYPSILDLCAGSGALALGLQDSFPHAAITAVEIDEKAFEYLVYNCKSYLERKTKAPITVKGNAFTYHETLPNESLDLIVSNPPYVTKDEYTTLAPELYFEPEIALVGEEEGLAFYKGISQLYYSKLKIGGKLVFEIGNEQGNAVSHIMQSVGYSEVGIEKDMSGNDRIAFGVRLK